MYLSSIFHAAPRAALPCCLQLSVAPLVSEAILRVQLGQSLQRLRLLEGDKDKRGARGPGEKTPRYRGQE